MDTPPGFSAAAAPAVGKGGGQAQSAGPGPWGQVGLLRQLLSWVGGAGGPAAAAAENSSYSWAAQPSCNI